MEYLAYRPEVLHCVPLDKHALKHAGLKQPILPARMKGLISARTFTPIMEVLTFLRRKCVGQIGTPRLKERPNSVEAYAYDLCDFYNYLDHCETQLSGATPTLLRNYVGSMYEVVSPATGKVYALKTIKRRLSTVRQFLLFCQKRGWLKNRFEVEFRRVKGDEIEVLEPGIDQELAESIDGYVKHIPPADLQLLLAEVGKWTEEVDGIPIAGPRDRLIAELGFQCGLRREEPLGLKTSDLTDANVLDFVIKWTSVIRENAPEHVKDHVFLCANKWKGDGEWIRSLGEPENGRFVAMPTAIYNFLRPRFKKYIGTRVIRASFAEHLNQLLDGDLESVGILLGHGSISVTAGSYRSAQARLRDETALAGAMLARDRLVASKGKIDPRSASPSMDRTSATPGWDCLDPCDSPIPGQVYGRPCTAYGHCPSCELGSRCRNPVIALARSLQLLDRMHETQDEIGVVAFDKQFGKPFLHLTDVDIPELSTPENIEAVKRLSLNPLPSLL